MSNRSRARFRNEHTDAEPITPEQQADMDAALDAFETMEKDRSAGLSKWAGLVLRDREKALATPETADPSPAEDPRRAARIAAERAEQAAGLREPTPYEAAILLALGNRTTLVDQSRHRHRPVEVRIEVASGGIYGGTVEYTRIQARRRRNKAARAARKGRRLPVRGRVYRSKFGYPIDIPGITDRAAAMNRHPAGKGRAA